MNESLTETTCRTCNRTFHYEPVMIFGRDLARALHTDCEDCQHAEAERARRKNHDESLRRRREDVAAILPPDLLETDLDHPSFNRPLWRIVSRWQPGAEARSLGIIGPAARCKTRVMALLARLRITAGTRVTWTSAVRLKDAAADRHARDHQTSALARQHLSECQHTPWLFLDDLGKNEWSPAFESQLFQILDHRANHRLPTVWSANDHPEAFSQLISPINAWPIIGRLLDRCTLLDLREE